MMIVRIKTNVSAEAQEEVRERIKEQMKEGLIVHDDTIEITFANNACTQCGSTDLEEIKINNGEGELFSHILKCNKCEHLREIVK